MWTLISIEASNIAAFKELHYNLKKGVTTLVFGNNMDNDSQGSNGSGKSALLEAISIALTGETLRKVKMDEIINDSADKAFVEAVFHNCFTNEDFIVSRTLSRNEPQQIDCRIGKDGEEVETDETKQPGVAEANKYILLKIGLSKDEIFNNFILSKHKFHCFLDSPDKDKKEIINRFSNAIIVDDSIKALQEDMVPVETKLRTSELTVSKVEGSIAALEEQIVKAEQEQQEHANSKPKREVELKNAISTQRTMIRESRNAINEYETSIKRLDTLYNCLCDIEQDESLSFEGCYKSISSLFATHQISGFEDWTDKAKTLHDKINSLQIKKESILKLTNEALLKCQHSKEELVCLQTKYSKYESNSSMTVKRLEKQINEAVENIQALESGINGLQTSQRDTHKLMVDLQNKIAGIIVCPKCSHQFVLDESVNIEDVKKQISNLQNKKETILKEYDSKTEEINKLELSKQSITTQKRDVEKGLRELSNKLNEHINLTDSLNRDYLSLQGESNSVDGEIKCAEKSLNDMINNMFDSAFSIVDSATAKYKSDVKSKELLISTCEGSIKTYQQAIDDLDKVEDGNVLKKLKESLIQYEKESVIAVREKNKIENELDVFKHQEQVFVEFKTHLANSKIDALSKMTNEFLEKIGSDIRIQFNGFTVLKSGKVRDKISISLIRNGVDCGSFGKFSEGEKARVNLANILAMYKLTNVNCEEGKGLDLLVLDEILEATDENGLTSIFDALNSLQITSLVVSHGNIAENYPHRLVVNKKNGISFINENEQ